MSLSKPKTIVRGVNVKDESWDPAEFEFSEQPEVEMNKRSAVLAEQITRNMKNGKI